MSPARSASGDSQKSAAAAPSAAAKVVGPQAPVARLLPPLSTRTCNRSAALLPEAIQTASWSDGRLPLARSRRITRLAKPPASGAATSSSPSTRATEEKSRSRTRSRTRPAAVSSRRASPRCGRFERRGPGHAGTISSSYAAYSRVEEEPGGPASAQELGELHRSGRGEPPVAPEDASRVAPSSNRPSLGKQRRERGTGLCEPANRRWVSSRVGRERPPRDRQIAKELAETGLRAVHGLFTYGRPRAWSPALGRSWFDERLHALGRGELYSRMREQSARAVGKKTAEP